VLPGRFISHYLAKEMLEIWLSTAFEGGRHQTRLDIISDYEQKEK
jgi:ribose 5-phosphate isomerase RpiB